MSPARKAIGGILAPSSPRSRHPLLSRQAGKDAEAQGQDRPEADKVMLEPKWAPRWLHLQAAMTGLWTKVQFIFFPLTEQAQAPKFYPLSAPKPVPSAVMPRVPSSLPDPWKLYTTAGMGNLPAAAARRGSN